MPGVEIAIKDPDQEGLGEIIVRHPHMMTAYYRNPDASAEMFDGAGWFLTGDAGYLTPGRHLVVVDRAKDLAVTSTGVRFSPQYIENKLKFSPFVAEAVDHRRWSALPDLPWSAFAIRSWANGRRSGASPLPPTPISRPGRRFTPCSAGEVEAVNASLPGGPAASASSCCCTRSSTPMTAN
jgi:long-chain acyl-CoA synthetase